MPIAAHFETTANAGRSGEVSVQGGATPEVGKPRDARRRLLLETQGTFASGSESGVSVHNLSRTGILLETSVSLEIGEIFELTLPEAGATRARVVWASDRLYGCAFDSALSEAVLSASQLRSAVQGHAGVLPEAPKPAPATAMIGGESLGERIYRLRKLKGLTQGELAARLGVSKPTVWAWEQGRARPIEERMAAIAEVLGVESDDLRPDRFTPGLSDVVSRCRDQIASVVETTPDKVRIMIEL